MLEPKRLDLYPHGLEGFRPLAYTLLTMVLGLATLYVCYVRGWLS